MRRPVSIPLHISRLLPAALALAFVLVPAAWPDPASLAAAEESATAAVEPPVEGAASSAVLAAASDSFGLGTWVDEVLAANAGEVARYKGGEVKLIGFFVGQVMKKSGGKADPKKVQPVILDKLKS